MSIGKPPLFDGNSSGSAWWREFTLWVVSVGATDDKLILLALKSCLRKDALRWFLGLTDSEKASWLAIEPLFTAKFPGDEDSLLPEVLTNPRLEFRQFLKRTIEPKDLTEVVEVPALDGTEGTDRLYRYQNWAREAYLKALKVSAKDMSQVTMGEMIRDALPFPLNRLVSHELETATDICRCVARLPEAEVRDHVDRDRRLAAVEALAKQHRHAPPAAPGTSYTNRPPLAPAAGRPSGGGQPTSVLQPHEHLVFSADEAGKAAYAKALEAYNKAFGNGLAVSTARAMPLSPGTLPPGPDVCNSCGLKGHLQADCSNSAVPDREKRFRGICSAAMRRANPVAAKALNVFPDFEAMVALELETALQQGN